MIESILPRVRRRLRLASTLRGAAVGCAAGCLVAFLLTAAVATGAATLDLGGWVAASAIAIAAMTTLGGAIGFGAVCNDQKAAQIVDRRYRLKDRTLSAIELNGEETMRRLQRRDAEGHLDRVDPAECVPLTAERTPLGVAAGLATAAGLLMALHLYNAPPVLARATLPVAASTAEGLEREMLAEIKQLAEQSEDPAIEELLRELRDKVDRLKTEPVDEADLLAELSDMESALAEARASMQIELNDEIVASLAKAIEPADSMRDAGEALKDQDYDRAAEEFAAVDPKDLADQERRAVADNVKRMVQNLGGAKPGSLSGTLSKLAENLDNQNLSECKKCLGKLAKACQKQSQCKKCGQCLAKQMNLLAQCKGQCRGQCDSPFARKSDSPSTTAGSAASGDPNSGPATRLDGSRQQDQITGTMGDRGDSETELLQSPEAQQGAARGYTAKYQDYRRQAEAVLQSEPLPQSHRQTVRAYFEAIRPDAGQDPR